MTDLVITEESKQYQELARDFSQKEIAPRAESFDHSGQLPEELWRKAWDIGLMNVRVPEQYGGLGLSLLDACIIAEELAAGCAAISAAFLGTDLALAPLLVAGSNEQKDKYVAPLMTDFAVAGYCFSEGSKLTLSGSPKQMHISGEAIAINATKAPWFLVHDTDGKRAAIVAVRAKGVKVGESLPRLGLKCADLATVHFDNVAAEADDLIDLSSVSPLVVASTAPLVAAYCIGVARAGLEHSIRYSKERFTFGVPIGNHQAVGFMLADMAKNIEAARLMTHKAAWLVDHQEGSVKASVTARHFASEMAMAGATDAVQVFGGYGYSREYPVEKLMRDAKMLQLFEGNPQSNRILVAQELVATPRS